MVDILIYFTGFDIKSVFEVSKMLNTLPDLFLVDFVSQERVLCVVTE